MARIAISETPLPGAFVIEPERRGDERGFFSEVYRAQWFEGLGAPDFVQDNHAFSAAKGVLRGLHFQVPPSPQGKLVRVSRGAAYDVAVDLRVGSPTYGSHHAEILSAANWRQFWIPAGFAHGYLTLEPDTELLYKVTHPWDPATEQGIAFDDKDLGIAWPLGGDALTLSARDRTLGSFAEFRSPFTYGPF